MTEQTAPSLDEVRDALRQTPYTVTSLLHVSGLSTLWLARHKRSNERIVIKQLIPDAGGAFAQVQFDFEGQVLCQLHHPSIVQLLDSGLDTQGHPYHVYEHIVGRPLDTLIRGGIGDAELAMMVARRVAPALAYIHGSGYVHRDIKPANIIWDGMEATLLDFGLVRDMGPYQMEPLDVSDVAVLRRGGMTDTGVIVGTADYLAPELVSGNSADHRADLYSFGLTLYKVAHGSLPFGSASDPAAIMARIAQPFLPTATGSPQLDAVINRLLQRQPEDRYETAAQVYQDLDAA